MRVPFRGILFTIATILLSSCKSHTEPLPLLQEDRCIIGIKPDIALLILDSHNSHDELSETDYMVFQLRIEQTHFLNFITTSIDTAIFKIINYFAQKAVNNWKFSFLSYFYRGFDFRINKHFDTAIKEFKQCLVLGRQYRNEGQRLIGFYNISVLHYDKRCYDLALAYYKHFETGLDLAKDLNDKARETDIMQKLAIVHCKKEDYIEALPLWEQDKELDLDTKQFARYYLNLANKYLASGENNSLVSYTKKLQELVKVYPDIYLQVVVNQFLAYVFEADGNLQMAKRYFKTQNICLLHIVKEGEIKVLTDAEGNYNMPAIEKMFDSEKGHEQLNPVATIIALAFVLTGGAGFYFYNKHRRQMEEICRLRNETSKNVYLNQVYYSYLGDITLFKNYINDLAVSYSLKATNESRAGYAKIEKALEEMEKNINERCAPFVSEFIRSLKLMDDGQISRLK